jgi:hypothetical protein
LHLQSIISENENQAGQRLILADVNFGSQFIKTLDISFGITKRWKIMNCKDSTSINCLRGTLVGHFVTKLITFKPFN